MAFDEETAGRLMQREYVAAPEGGKVGDVIDRMRSDSAELLIIKNDAAAGMYASALNRYALPALATASATPANIGPMKCAPCAMLELSAAAFVRCERGTRAEIIAMRAGYRMIFRPEVSAVATRMCQT